MFGWRTVVLILGLSALAGCSRSGSGGAVQAPTHPAPTDELARQCIKSVFFGFGRAWADSETINHYCARSQVDRNALRDSAIALLRSGSEDDRRSAALILQLLRDPEAVSPLAAVMRNDASSSVRLWACHAVASFGPRPEVERAFVDALNNTETTLRVEVVHALGFDSSYRVTDRLREVMRTDPDLAVRVEAARALVHRDQRDDEVVLVLRSGLSRPEVCEGCEEALERLGLLEIPIPECEYVAVGLDVYRRHLKESDAPKSLDGIWTRVERVVEKAGRIYYELHTESHNHHVPFVLETRREWYVAGPGQAAVIEYLMTL